MTLADSHVKALLKEGTTRAGNPPSGSEWRVSPEAVAAAKEKAEEFLRALGESAAHTCGNAKVCASGELLSPARQSPRDRA